MRHTGGQVRSDLRGELFVRHFAVVCGLDVDDVHHVHVGNIVQLAGATLTHPDHGQTHLIDQRLIPLLVGLRASHGQSRLDGGTGQIGELAAHRRHVLHRVQGADVANSHLGDASPIGDTECLVGIRTSDGGRGDLGLGIRPDRLQQASRKTSALS